MRIVLVADAFPPMRTSAAVQLRDLTREFVRQGHQITVMLPDAELRDEWQVEDFAGVEVLRLRALQTKDVNHVRRTLAEFMMPLVMMHRLRKSPLADVRWDGVIWYSPSIFHGPLVRWLKTRSACRSYLIVRDIFPEWALDVGLLHRGLPYLFFRAVARYQYAQADTIGVQTPGNRIYFTNWERQPGRRLEVLQNWLAEPPNTQCSIDVSKTKLAGRKVCVYAGNMGVAQGIDVLIDLADRLKTRDDVGFLFVGRGSEVGRLAEVVTVRGLNNVLFHEEIDPDEIPGLYAQCHVGLVALDPRHKTHNIPGKFLTYMQSGLPVIASVNSGNDLIEMIRSADVGYVSGSGDPAELASLADRLFGDLGAGVDMSARCKKLFSRLFTTKTAVQQLVGALRS